MSARHRDRRNLDFKLSLGTAESVTVAATPTVSDEYLGIHPGPDGAAEIAPDERAQLPDMVLLTPETRKDPEGGERSSSPGSRASTPTTWTHRQRSSVAFTAEAARPWRFPESIEVHRQATARPSSGRRAAA
jgi:hypothetical protein